MASVIEMYGMRWPSTVLPVVREMDCIRKGGRWKGTKGQMCGAGLFHHYKMMQSYLWPEKVWHKWANYQLEHYIKHRFVGVLGPASSGKSYEAALWALSRFYIYPDKTTVMICSTEREMLEMRIWGEMKKFHRMAKERFSWLPGNLIESRQRIVMDDKSESAEGRDFRCGCVGIPCKRGGNFQGMGSFVGIKNDYVLLIADELHLMPRVFIDAISNLNKNKGFQAVGLGNPKETTDAFGAFCEPAAELGGWDGGIDQAPKTKAWPTRFNNGICLQLPGSDSPNMDTPEGQPPPYPFLITREAIAADIAFYGKDSLQYTMMDEGRMPRGQGTRRVITRQLCQKFGASDDVIWQSDKRTKIASLDAAYRGVGGDRCIVHYFEFGPDKNAKQVVKLVDKSLVPIVVDSGNPAEDQIALFVKKFCEDRGVQPENFGFDSTGRGSLMGAFARLWSPYVVPIEFGGKASDRRVSADIDVICRDYYSKFVTELWWSVRLCIEAGQMRGLTEDIIQEGSMREWRMVSGNRIEVETKEDMKVKSGRSPDDFDTLVCGIEMCRRRGFSIQKLGTNKSRESFGMVYRQIKDRMEAIRKNHSLNYAA